MRIVLPAICSLILSSALGHRAWAQTASELATLELRVKAHPDGASLDIQWPARTDVTEFSVRRLVDGRESPAGRLPASSTGFTDEIAPGVRYRYLIGASPKNSLNPVAQGYLETGVNLPAVEDRGRVLLLIERDLTEAISSELARWELDLIGDGWRTSHEVVSAEMAPPEVKAIIVRRATASPVPLKAVILVGHVPVPYSGAVFPDGHNAHLGAWPADVYYGDLNGEWTDSKVDVTSGYPRNHNVPGDGHFDQSHVPSPVEVAVGRIDFSALPAFAPKTEVDLLKEYLERNHRFRQGGVVVREDALVVDGLAHLREPISAPFRRDANALLGPAKTIAEPWFGSGERPFLIGYACGYGSFTSLASIGTTEDLAKRPCRSLFSLALGSYHGDWDNSDNFVRALLASGETLASSWSGRPSLSLAGMATGGDIGACLRESQYPIPAAVEPPLGYFGRSVHLALHGDPTLRAHPQPPVTGLKAQRLGDAVELRWNRDEKSHLGYRLYRAPNAAGPFESLHEEPLVEPSFVDHAPGEAGTYLVRAIALTVTASGSYQNLTQGAFIELPARVAEEAEPETPATDATDPRAVTLRSWRAAKFGSAGEEEEVSGPSADPDADGLPNLLEYALDTNPMAPDGPLLRVAKTSDGWRISHSVNHSAKDVHLRLEASEDLQSWTALRETPLTDSSGESGVHLWEDSSNGQRFFRLRVEWAPQENVTLPSASPATARH